MKIPKHENFRRNRESAHCTREDFPMHPEQLCDIDILYWRQAEFSWGSSRSEVTATVDIEVVRINDISSMCRDPNNRNKDMTQISSHIRRTST